MVVVNDTPAVALDNGAANAARAAGLEVLPVGVVGGTGTNAAVDSGGLVNLEIGHAPWSDNAVSRRMRQNSWTKGCPELEQETGMYLTHRLAAGMQLLGEQGLVPESDAAAVRTLAESRRSAAFISELAAGATEGDPLRKELARLVLRRAGQVYGVMLAAIAEAMVGTRGPGQPPLAVPAEGSVLLRGGGVKAQAERTATLLGQPVALMEASGLRGVAALVLSWPHLTQPTRPPASPSGDPSG